MGFFDAVLRFGFLQNALAAAVLAGVLSGVVGTWVVVRRIAVLAGAIAHSVLAGLGAARWLQVVHGVTWADPMLGATVAALVAAAVIGFVSSRGGEREDTAIAAIWAVGMAVGVLFIARTPGYHEDLMSYLFGDILLVRPADLWLMAGLDLVLLATAVVLHQQIQAVSFDEEFARLRGLPTGWYEAVVLVFTALAVVLLVSMVGLVLVIALLTLPAAVAGRFTSSLGGMMVLGAALAVTWTVLGIWVGFAADLPAGATTIVLAGAAYLIVAVMRR